MSTDGTLCVRAVDYQNLFRSRIGENDEYVSPAVLAGLGHTIALTLESNLVRSTVGVW